MAEGKVTGIHYLNDKIVVSTDSATMTLPRSKGTFALTALLMDLQNRVDFYDEERERQSLKSAEEASGGCLLD